MPPIVSLVGIVVGLVILIALAYRGHSIIWAAPVCAIIVAILGGINILDAYWGDYLSGTAGYVISWFPAFATVPTRNPTGMFVSPPASLP